MGKNKLRKFAEINKLQHVFQYSYSDLKEKGFPFKGRWRDFFNNDNPIVLELGCGKGEYTVNLAYQNPDQNFIGIDIKGARMWHGAKESYEKGISNVAFVRTNIELINYFFSKDEVSEIWITFPDPQMQKHTKRLTSTTFMLKYNYVLKSQGSINLKTDSNFLYQYTLEMIKVNNLNLLTQYGDLYNEQPDNPEFKIKTYYEEQWIARGMLIKYVKFNLDNIASLIEPDVEIEHDSYRSFNRENAQKL